MSNHTRIKVAQFGLGPIGIESLKLLAQSPWAQVVGGIDIDPAKQGKTLADLTGESTLSNANVFRSFDEMVQHDKPDVVLHTAGSSVTSTIEQIGEMVEAGVSVATTCEPMLYPWLTAPHEAEMLDAAAETRQVAVVGTGVNPGFAMDLLPVVATNVMRHVDRIYVERVVDASTRRGPLQKKIGSGMNPEAFLGLFREGRAGHAGFRESVALLAVSMGWPVNASMIQENLEPVIATREIKTDHFTVQPGQTRGLHQVATMQHEGVEVIRLDLTMALAEPHPHDTIEIHGDRKMVVSVPAGIPGDTATVAALVNAVPRLLDARPGVRTMTELGAPRFGASAARTEALHAV